MHWIGWWLKTNKYTPNVSLGFYCWFFLKWEQARLYASLFQKKRQQKHDIWCLVIGFYSPVYPMKRTLKWTCFSSSFYYIVYTHFISSFIAYNFTRWSVWIFSTSITRKLHAQKKSVCTTIAYKRPCFAKMTGRSDSCCCSFISSFSCVSIYLPN